MHGEKSRYQSTVNSTIVSITLLQHRRAITLFYKSCLATEGLSVTTLRWKTSSINTTRKAETIDTGAGQKASTPCMGDIIERFRTSSRTATCGGRVVATRGDIKSRRWRNLCRYLNQRNSTTRLNSLSVAS